MNRLKVKHSKGTTRFKVADNWNEVPFKTYLKWKTEDLSQTQVYELFTGVSAEIWEQPHLPELYASIDAQLGFLNTEPLTEVPTHLEYKGNYNAINKDFLNVPLGKYRDLIEIINSLAKEEDVTKIMAKMVSIFALDKYETNEEIEEAEKDVLEMPTDVVYSLAAFFLKRLNELKSGTRKKWIEVVKERILTILKLALTRSLTILVISIVFFLSPKVTLQSLMQYLKKQWVKYIVLRNLRVESVNRNQSTQD